MSSRPAPDCPVGYLEVDATGHVAWASAEAERRLGLTLEELTGRPVATLLSVAGRIFYQTHVSPELGLTGRVDEVYLSLKTKGGSRLPVLINAARRQTPEGFVDLLVFTPMGRRQLFEDEIVRSRREAEQRAQGEQTALARVQAMEAQLAVAERLAAVGTLAAGVAHEVNNPLAYVAMNLELLEGHLAQGCGDPACQTLVRDAQLGVSRIRDIVASLKKLSRVDDTRRDPVDLGHVVALAVKIAGAEVRHRAELVVDVAERAPVVLGDEGRLGQVAINLLVNAAQALCEKDLARNVVCISARYGGPDVAVLEVKDNGPGVPVDLEQRIFEPFFTTKPAGEGTGLGLAVCHGIVTSLGGTIALERPAAGGACFRVTLPAFTARAPSVAPRATSPRLTPVPAAGAGARRRVLVVDDDDAILRVFPRALPDCEVVCCSSGPAALERLAAAGFEAFDAILCDLMMPEMTGMGVHEAVRQRSPAAARRMVFMTGGTFTEGARIFLDETPNLTLPKPFTRGDLRRVIEAVHAAELQDPAPSA